MPAFYGFELDYAGVAEILTSPDVAGAVRDAAHQVADAARAQGHRVTSGEPLPVEVYNDPDADRAGRSQRAVIRLTCWHRTPHSSKALTALAVGLLCTPDPSRPWTAEPLTGPVNGIDPYSDKPLATAALVVFSRTPSRT